MAEDNAAERAEEEADAEGREGCERAHRRANLWEKNSRLNTSAAVMPYNRKIVPVDDGAGKSFPMPHDERDEEKQTPCRSREK